MKKSISFSHNLRAKYKNQKHPSKRKFHTKALQIINKNVSNCLICLNFYILIVLKLDFVMAPKAVNLRAILQYFYI